MKKFLIILFGTLLISACEDPIEIELPNNTDFIVVEGWVTNQPGPQGIRLTRTIGFNETGNSAIVNDAIVRVVDDLGNIEQYNFQNGVYLSAADFIGEMGRSYALNISLANGEQIESAAELLRAPVSIDSLGFDFILEPSDEDPRGEIEVFFPVAFAQDPPNETNFYRWIVSRNNIQFGEPEDITLLSDRFINGNSFQNELTQFRFEESDTIHLELQSISANAFDFLQLLRNQTVSLGTSSGTSPTAIVGNLRNLSNPDDQVLGFFGAFSSTENQAIINP